MDQLADVLQFPDTIGGKGMRILLLKVMGQEFFSLIQF
jgi:hypothetical protein